MIGGLGSIAGSTAWQKRSKDTAKSARGMFSLIAWPGALRPAPSMIGPKYAAKTLVLTIAPIR